LLQIECAHVPPVPGVHVSPQIEPTSLTQIASHCTWQQYGSVSQMSDAHGSHDGSSVPPCVQVA
jgi:hypothetical protein